MTESKYETKTTVFDREHAEYTMESYVDKETGKISHHKLNIKEKDSSGLLSTTWMVVDHGSDIVEKLIEIKPHYQRGWKINRAKWAQASQELLNLKLNARTAGKKVVHLK